MALLARENRSTLAAFAIFIAMFWIYVGNHPAGFTANVVQTAANKGVLLALVAMAQTMVVITAGIDLSVGMTFVLCNCLASQLLAGDAWRTGVGLVLVLAAGAACGAVNGLLVIFGRLQPIVATIASGAIYFGLALWLRPDPGGASDFNSDFADLFTGKLSGSNSGEPGDARRRGARGLVSLQPVGDRPHGLRGRLVGIVGLYVGSADPRARNSSSIRWRGCWPGSAASS